jgi:hypothetical protein
MFVCELFEEHTNKITIKINTEIEIYYLTVFKPSHYSTEECFKKWKNALLIEYSTNTMLFKRYVTVINRRQEKILSGEIAPVIFDNPES